jgi:hypothetical protein
MNREILERFVVRILEIGNRCSDLIIQRDLMRLANEIVDTIEQQNISEQTGHGQ